MFFYPVHNGNPPKRHPPCLFWSLKMASGELDWEVIFINAQHTGHYAAKSPFVVLPGCPKEDGVGNRWKGVVTRVGTDDDRDPAAPELSEEAPDGDVGGKARIVVYGQAVVRLAHAPEKG